MRYIRRILVAVFVALVLIAAAGAGVDWWFNRGPGFARECDRLAAVALIGPGMSVADVGAGSGHVAASMAIRIGPSGRLFATEIEEALLRRIREGATAKGLTNVTAILAGESATGLDANCCDVIYLRRVYHHLADPRAIAASLYSSLRPGGRLVIIDMWMPARLPFVRHGIPSEAVRSELERAGFRLERRLEWWSPIDYCMVFRKASSSSLLRQFRRPNPPAVLLDAAFEGVAFYHQRET
jgi:ubiquinone/menaquinone biosynthesis C-methylase UbiE